MDNAEKSLRDVNIRIEKACENCGRNSSEITLIGASKSVSASRLQEFFAAGLKTVGENYVQEAVRKQREIEQLSISQNEVATFETSPNQIVESATFHSETARLETPQSSTRFGLIWHFIGALQSNKAREVVGRFALIHSVDRTRLAQALNDEARTQKLTQPVLLQVNLGDESSKAGCDVDELFDLFDFCRALPSLKVRGLMCLPPAQNEAEKSRVYFRQLRQLRDELNSSSTRNEMRLTELSMGMSADFEIAIEEGATLIRVGTALFGSRF